MGVVVTTGDQKDITNTTPFRMKYRKVTFDSSYPTGGESVTAASFGLSTLHSLIVHGPAVKSDLTDAVGVTFNPATSKLVCYRAGAAASSINIEDSNDAATEGVAVYVHIDEILEQGSALAHLEFISPTTTDGTGTLASGGATYYIQHDAAANTGGFALYLDEDATSGSRLLAAMGRNCYVMASNGEFVKITHNATPATPGVQVYFDEDAAATHQRLRFVSPTDADGSEVTAQSISMQRGTAVGEVLNTTDLSAYSVYVTAIGS